MTDDELIASLKKKVADHQANLIKEDAKDLQRRLRIIELRNEWDRLCARELRIGKELNERPDYKPDPAVLVSIASEKKRVKEALVQFGEKV